MSQASDSSGGRIPAGVELSEAEILHALIPNYDLHVSEAADHPDDPAYSPFTAVIEDSVKTNFGIPGKDYLLVAVAWGKGSCGGCYPTAFGIFDLKERTLVWHWETGGLHTASRLSVFRISPSGPWAFSLRFAEGSQGGASFETERWLKPRLDGGHLECDELWSGVVNGSNAGNRGGGTEQSCGWMASAQKPGEYEFRRSTFYAAPCAEGENEPGFFQLPCSRQRESYRKCSPVEIERVERWITEDGRLKRISSKSDRIDHGESGVFPFDLPTRSSFFRLSPDSIHVFFSANEARLIDSPDKKYRLIFEKPCGRAEVSLFRGGRHLRTVRVQQGDSFDGRADFLGWSSDSKRFFVVVRFGLAEGRALLSFSVDGEGDYWEKLLTDDPTEWKDGFVLEPARPAAKRPGTKVGGN